MRPWQPGARWSRCAVRAMASSSEPKKYTDAQLYDYAGDMLAPGTKRVTVDVVLAIAQRYRELIDAERKRKGRPAHRPRSSDIGEEVEAQKAVLGGNVTKARQAVAAKRKLPVKRVAQAHHRWLSRSK